MRAIRVSLMADLVQIDPAPRETYIVLDILRATTTITYALAAGATRVVPCLEIDQALATAKELGRANVLLAGERGGRLIPGFDLGNSPEEFTTERVAGCTIVFTTTNGTRALHICRDAADILIGSFANLSAVCHAAQTAEHLHIVCAGTDHRLTREDVLAAGAIVDQLTQELDAEIDDQASVARDAWRGVVGEGFSREVAGSTVPFNESLFRALCASQGGRNLLALGLERDIQVAARIDRYRLVPLFDPETRSIEPASGSAGSS